MLAYMIKSRLRKAGFSPFSSLSLLLLSSPPSSSSRDPAKGMILVCNITNAKSFESLSECWMAQLNAYASPNDLAKLLVGNKSDLEASREVSKEKAQQFCQDQAPRVERTSCRPLRNLLRQCTIGEHSLLPRLRVE